MCTERRNWTFTSNAIMAAIVLSVAACSGDSNNNTDPASDEPANTGSGTTQNTGSIGSTTRTAFGDVFVHGDINRTLYTFANDQDDVSNCSNNCLVNWPAVIASEESSSGQFTTIRRDDGSLQWAFKNRPVYFYQGDAGEGDVNGEGLGGVWYVARPDPTGTGETSIGTVLVGKGSINDGSSEPASRRDVDGMTLYTFRNDATGSSSCNDQCALNWPPHFADKGALPGNGFSLVTRADGSLQWASAGKALYFYQGDSIAGDINGNGVNDLWDVAKP